MGRFDELGWVQFERLCGTLLEDAAGIDRAEWLPRPSSAVALLPDGLELAGAALPGPTLVVLAWARGETRRLRALIERILAEWEQQQPRSLALVTNAELDAEAVALDGRELLVLGPSSLEALVDASPELRLREPSVLGVCELDPLVGDELRALARVFVRTRAYEHALAALEQHRFAVLTGPPEMGKTAIARMIGLAKATAGWELHECIRPDELWSRFARDRPQVFVADDAFGSTEYHPDAAERWSVELYRALHALDERHWLIWTSRPAPLNAALRRIHREHGIERFPQPAQVEVDAADLSVEEKALILFRHAKAASPAPDDVRLVQTHGWSIVDHPHFTPERIRRFVERLPALAGEDDLEEAVAREIREPTAAMQASFRALEPAYRAVLVALLDIPPGPATDRELAAAVRRHAGAGPSLPAADVVDRLADHFLRRIGGTDVTWVHPSWRDLVIEELAGSDADRTAFLHACSLDGLLLALSLEGGAAGERTLPLLRGDADWDLATDALARLVPELDEPGSTRLLTALREARAVLHDGELDALGREALRTLARCWSRREDPPPVGLLELWLEVAATLTDPPERPELGRAWIELLPTVSIDLSSADELTRLDEWLALVEVLEAHAPDELERFGFPDRQVEVAEAAVASARGAALGAEPPHALGDVLRRLARAVPAVAFAAFEVRDLLAAEAPDELPPVAPRALSPELQRLLDEPPSALHAPATVVARVLRDL